MHLRRARSLALAAGVAILLAACGTGNGSSHGAPTTSSQLDLEARQQYLSDVAPANAAIAGFKAQVLTWTGSTSDSTARADAHPLVTALEGLQQALRSQRWPKVVRYQVQKEAVDISPEIVDLQNVTVETAATGARWIEQFDNDEVNLHTDVIAVRKALGLPPPPTPAPNGTLT
jgi:hypothetical protein